jgi:SAM-dependent methyltransferase
MEATMVPETTDTTEITESVDEFVGRFVTDLAAVLHGATVLVGDKLGLYKAMARDGAVTPVELAGAVGCDARFVEEWLNAQAASAYCHYDPATRRYHLDDAQRTCLADETHPAFVVGGMAVASSVHKDEEAVTTAFRTGEGLGWHQHHTDLFMGTERFFRPGYVGNLATSWIPALHDVEAKLQAGARVADIGCGHGSSSILLGQSYPASTVTGFDYHGPSIDTARTRAADAGVADRVAFEIAAADAYPGVGYDLVCIFDALHDMGDPAGALRHIRSSLAPDGTLLLVEPNAGDRVEDNLNLVGRIFYSASSAICTPASRHQSGDAAACLGAQAGEARLRGIAEAAGFTRFRRAAETPFNIVLEVRP